MFQVHMGDAIVKDCGVSWEKIDMKKLDFSKML